MTHEFEDPRKKELRLRAQAAIEAAGHEVLDEPVPIDYPDGTDLKGRIRGDIQSVDGGGVRYICFVRPDAERALPEWIRNTVLAAAALDDVLVHVVIGDKSEIIEEGSRACGAGLLLATEDMTLEQLLEPTDPDPDAELDAIRARAKDLRYRLSSKTNLNLVANEKKFSDVTALTANMPASTRDKYVLKIEEADRTWREWSENLAAEIDWAVTEQDASALDLLEALINAGPLDADVEEDTQDGEDSD